jgi:hypothetical protein
MRQARGRASGRGLEPSQVAASQGFAEISKGGAAVRAQLLDVMAKLPDLPERRADSRVWGKLPPKLARDLMEGQREKVAEEYRAMVETYFRVIAEKARKNSK